MVWKDRREEVQKLEITKVESVSLIYPIHTVLSSRILCGQQMGRNFIVDLQSKLWVKPMVG